MEKYVKKWAFDLFFRLLIKQGNYLGHPAFLLEHSAVFQNTKNNLMGINNRLHFFISAALIFFVKPHSLSVTCFR